MNAAVEVTDLKKTFGGGVQALDGLSLEVAQGSVFGLLGPNGAGKTTMIRILATLLTPTSGSAKVFGYDVVHQASQVRSLIGLTGQYAAVDELISGWENLRMIGRLGGLGNADARRRADDLLEAFGLAEAGGKGVKTYSGGMRRRLDLAASLVTEPRILFLDEPTTGLDPSSRGLLWNLIRERAARGTTVFLTTQYLEEADHLSDQVAVIDHGRVVASGPPEGLKAEVGGQRLEVRPVSSADIPAVRQVLADIMDLPPTTSTEGQTVSAPIDDPAEVLTVLQRLGAIGVPIGQLSVRGPSLDEVFLALTDERPQAIRTAKGGAT